MHKKSIHIAIDKAESLVDFFEFCGYLVVNLRCLSLSEVEERGVDGIEVIIFDPYIEYLQNDTLTTIEVFSERNPCIKLIALNSLIFHDDELEEMQQKGFFSLFDMATAKLEDIHKVVAA
ncbi:MAG: hypothetical protein Q7R99_02550 [bacterium]|nr:hypothetical protein [bacterium]